MSNKKLTQEQIDKIVERLDPPAWKWYSDGGLVGADLSSFSQRGDKTFFSKMNSAKITNDIPIISIIGDPA